jgi:hypothetical protein
MDEFGRLAYQEMEIKRIAQRRVFWLHFVVWVLTGLLLFVIWLLATPNVMPWFVIPILAWAIGVGAHAAWVFMVRSPQEIIMDRERPAETGEQPSGPKVEP